MRFACSLIAAGATFLTIGCRKQILPPAPDSSGTPTYNVPEIKAGDDLKLVLYGDMRFTDPANKTDTNPRVRKWLVDRIADEKPDALFVSGDLPFRGGIGADWDVYRQETEPWSAAHLRVYPTLGNHELVPTQESSLPNYFAEFPWLQGRHWYSVLLGNIELIALDSNAEVDPKGIEPGGPQRVWLESQLDHLPSQVDFVFFLIHMPLINDVQSEVIADLPAAHEVALNRYLVSQSPHFRAKFVVVCGHVHNYERFEQNGISYIVSGGGGAKPYRIFARNPEDLYKDPGFPNFNYLVATVHGKQTDATMYRVVDPKAKTLATEVKDKFTLYAR